MFDPPIFVFDDTVDAFPSVEAMTQYVEPWDVAETTKAFDSTGRVVALRSEGVVRTRWTVGDRNARTFVDEAASGEPQPNELAALLRDHLEGLGSESSPLAELVSVAVARIGLTT